MAGSGPDHLLLQGLRFFGHHGHGEPERREGGFFVVDLDVSCSLEASGRSDQLSDTVNYVELYQLVRALVEQRRFKLLEALATEIAASVLELPLIEEVTVRLTKEPRLPAQTVGFAVQLTRRR